jgi:hypothetical protein
VRREFVGIEVLIRGFGFDEINDHNVSSNGAEREPHGDCRKRCGNCDFAVGALTKPPGDAMPGLRLCVFCIAAEPSAA